MRRLRTLYLLSHSHSAMNGVKIEVRSDPSQVEKDLIFNSLAEFNESQVGDARLGFFQQRYVKRHAIYHNLDIHNELRLFAAPKIRPP